MLNLRNMGAQVEEYEMDLPLTDQENYEAQPSNLRRPPHSKAFTVAALIAEGESEIKSADCVNVSFPEFFSLFRGKSRSSNRSPTVQEGPD